MAVMYSCVRSKKAQKCGERAHRLVHSNSVVFATYTCRIIHADNFRAICDWIPQFLKNEVQYIDIY